MVFKGSVTSLIPLYAVGVFTSFTLSQAGMVRHWFKKQGKGWALSAGVNLLGAVATGIVVIVMGLTKFAAGEPTGLRLPFGVDETGHPGTPINYGAWLVIALVPLLVVLFRKIRGHYADVARHLSALAFRPLEPYRRVQHTVLVLVSGLHGGIFPALEYARSLSADARAIYIEQDPAQTHALKEEWERFAGEVPLIILGSPYRTLLPPLVEYVREMSDERDDELTVVLPELVAAKRWWHRLLHNANARAIQRTLSQIPGVVVTSYRYFADKADGTSAGPRLPKPREGASESVMERAR